jgi:hypothetical protein
MYDICMLYTGISMGKKKIKKSKEVRIFLGQLGQLERIISFPFIRLKITI